MHEGDAFALTFDEPGTYDYVCRVHAPGMAGTDHGHARGSARRLSPKPRSSSSAVSPSPPRAGSRPSCVAAS